MVSVDRKGYLVYVTGELPTDFRPLGSYEKSDCRSPFFGSLVCTLVFCSSLHDSDCCVDSEAKGSLIRPSNASNLWNSRLLNLTNRRRVESPVAAVVQSQPSPQRVDGYPGL